MRIPPTYRHLGLNPLTLGCLAGQAVLLLLVVTIYRTYGLSLDVEGFKGIIASVVFLCWISFLIAPGRRKGWRTPEALFAWLLTYSLVLIVVPGQYAALALGRPFIDHTLAQIDATVGIDVPRLWVWTQAHPWVRSTLVWAYNTHNWQLGLAIPVFWLLRDRRAMWEYTFHFHVCLALTLLASGFWPVAGPYQHFEFTAARDFEQVIKQVNGFHDGTLTGIRLSEMDGLISMPSFHTATGLFVTWTVRRRRWLMVTMLVINSLLIVATVFTGIHYAADVFAGALLFMLSALAYPMIERRLAMDAPEPSIGRNLSNPAPGILLDRA